MRRKLFWTGVFLILLPTLCAVALTILTDFPREYRSSVFMEVGQSKIKHTVEVDRATIYAVLVLVAVHVPGIALLLTAFFGGRGAPSASGPPHI